MPLAIENIKILGLFLRYKLKILFKVEVFVVELALFGFGMADGEHF